MEEIQDLTWRAVEYAETCGLVVRGADCGCPSDGCYASVIHVPLTLRPTVMKRATFETVSNLQLLINKLIHAAANDADFIRSTLSGLIPFDDFWASLYRVWEDSRDNRSPAWLGLHRSDYLIENDTAKMVEFNTIASSMGGHAVGISEMHRSIGTTEELRTPPNNVICSLAFGMKSAVNLFCSKFELLPKQVCVIVLCEEGTSRNFSDQKRVELELQRQLNYQVDICRAPLSAFDDIEPDQNGIMKYRGKEVALFYLRAGYDPSCYECSNCTRLSKKTPTKQSWVNRLNIEKSRAVKSPPIGYHLLTNKLFQAVFAKKSVLERYMTSAEADVFLETACIDDLSSLSSPAVQAALDQPERYCLKILREGGAEGNLFGAEIVPRLKEMKQNEEIAKMYILMEIIDPNVIENTLVRCGKHETIGTISEVGIFGVYLFDKSSNEALVNSNDGHLIRTKPAASNVGGVAAGGACIGSIAFVDEEED